MEVGASHFLRLVPKALAPRPLAPRPLAPVRWPPVRLHSRGHCAYYDCRCCFYGEHVHQYLPECPPHEAIYEEVYARVERQEEMLTTLTVRNTTTGNGTPGKKMCSDSQIRSTKSGISHSRKTSTTITSMDE